MKKNILFVDDEKAINFIHEIMIEDMGLPVDRFFLTDGVHAKKEIEQVAIGEKAQYDLIFLDLNMPKMDGWEFLAWFDAFSSSHPAVKTKIVVLTSSLNPLEQERSLDFGCVVDYCLKPISDSKLKRLIGF